MLKRNVYLIFCLLLVITSCRKAEKQENILQNEVSLSTSKLFFEGTLDETNSLSQEIGGIKRTITPIKSKQFTKGFRYKIEEYDKNGNILSKGYLISLELLDKKVNLFEMDIDPKGRSISKDLNQSNSGKKTNINVVAKTTFKNNIIQSPLGEVLNLLAGCNTMPQICIDWYWTTYDPTSGAVVGEVYMYTSCYDPCSFTSGGSASNIQATCNQLADAMESGPVSENGIGSLISETANERTFSYNWVFQRQFTGMWQYRSFETGIHQKVNGTWKWKSLTHNSVSRSGVTAGTSIDCQVNNAIPQVGIYFAGMQLSYTILANAICEGFPISNNHTFNKDSPIWHVNYNPSGIQ